MLIDELRTYLDSLQKNGLYRQRQLLGEGDNTLNHRLNFSSNDYLSLTSDARIRQAYQAGFQHYPTGSGGSMLVCGYHPAHQALESAFAEALSVDACVVFSSGYVANLSIMSLLARVGVHALIDKSVHASIYDGLALSGAAYARYVHQQEADLIAKAQLAPKKTVWITESVFSMSGYLAPLLAMSQSAQTLGHALVVDEAHAFGVFGPDGMGCVAEHGLTQHEVPLRVIPFGKAGSSMGAIVAGDGVWIDALLQAARSHCYSTAVSPAVAYGLQKTLDVIRNANERRTKLHALVNYFRAAVSQSSLQWRDSSTPIQQLQLGCPHRALQAASQLRALGIVCMPMRQPTVSRQETGLRVILNYHHEPHDIDYLFQCLHTV